MLRMERQGIGWTVLRDGTPLKDDVTSGVHRTFYSAVRHIMREADQNSEHVEHQEWTRRHSNSRTAVISLDEDGQLWFGTLDVFERSQAADIEDAERGADQAASTGHRCDDTCGSWPR
jgi:hypothetical protein